MAIPTRLSTGWVPPSLSQVDTSDCNAIIPWVGAMAQAGLTYKAGFNMSREIPVQTVIQPLQSLLPRNWSLNNKMPTESDLLAWYLEVWTNSSITDPLRDDVSLTVLLTPLIDESCLPNLCPSLGWEGDSDVSGRGMIVSYALEAALVTIFAIFFGLGLVRPVQRVGARVVERVPRKLHAYNVYGAFESLAKPFLFAAMLFAIAMNVATIYRFASATQHDDRSIPLYGLLGSYYMAAFSILPAVLLQTAVRNEYLGHTFLRQTLWFSIIVFSITVNIMGSAFTTRLDQLATDFNAFIDSRDTDRIATRVAVNLQNVFWIQSCVDFETIDDQDTSYTVAVAFLSVNGFWWLCNMVYLFNTHGRGFPAPVRATARRLLAWRPRRWAVYLRVLNGLFACGLMWAMLGIFLQFRSDVGKTAGGSDKDSEWSFGQVLALATWASVILDFVRFIKGRFPSIGCVGLRV
jgi:hypothetical protein